MTPVTFSLNILQNHHAAKRKKEKATTPVSLAVEPTEAEQVVIAPGAEAEAEEKDDGVLMVAPLARSNKGKRAGAGGNPSSPPKNISWNLTKEETLLTICYENEVHLSRGKWTEVTMTLLSQPDFMEFKNESAELMSRRFREQYNKLRTSISHSIENQKINKSDRAGEKPRTHSIVQQMLIDEEEAAEERAGIREVANTMNDIADGLINGSNASSAAAKKAKNKKPIDG